MPSTVRTNVAPPAVAAAGFKPVSVGAAGLMVKVAGFDCVPPGLSTLTAPVPGAAIRFADTEAVNWVALLKAVDKFAPFHCTPAPATKFVPVTVSAKPGLPARREFGLRAVMVGTTGDVIVKVAALEGAAPGLSTVTLTVPAATISPAVTAAVSCVALTNVV